MFGPDAGRVAQHLLDGLRVLVTDLLGRNHGDRLRHLVQRRVGLRRRRAALRDIAVDRTVRALPSRVHAERRKLERPAVLSLADDLGLSLGAAGLSRGGGAGLQKRDRKPFTRVDRDTRRGR